MRGELDVNGISAGSSSRAPSVPEKKPGSGLFPYYENGDRLKAKHVGTNMVSGRQFVSWALGLIPLTTGAVILDAGCGWGRFTWPLIEEFGVDSPNVYCVDSSLGMALSAKKEAHRRRHYSKFAAAEIQALPFPTGHFDGVMANHVLYHLPDIGAGVKELARLVNENGWLLATTNSDHIRVPVLEYHYKALDILGIDDESQNGSPFSMENGKRLLEEGFKEVDLEYFEDSTRYSSADEFLASYKKIGRYHNLLARADVDQERKRQLPVLVHQQAQDEIDRMGELLSPVRMGAFVCRAPRP